MDPPNNHYYHFPHLINSLKARNLRLDDLSQDHSKARIYIQELWHEQPHLNYDFILPLTSWPRQYHLLFLRNVKVRQSSTFFFPPAITISQNFKRTLNLACDYILYFRSSLQAQTNPAFMFQSESCTGPLREKEGDVEQWNLTCQALLPGAITA